MIISIMGRREPDDCGFQGFGRGMKRCGDTEDTTQPGNQAQSKRPQAVRTTKDEKIKTLKEEERVVDLDTAVRRPAGTSEQPLHGAIQP